ncbi:MAG TPA: hypothetical protein DEQ50_08190 [Lactobacillus sp.]|nr:hypothetical protein [Lactobacillus sp.]
MNYKETYAEFVEEMFEQHHHDIEETIAYIAKNIATIDEWKPDFKQARRHLTSGEKNDIIWKIITPF